jgi:hypothetical protein
VLEFLWELLPHPVTATAAITAAAATLAADARARRRGVKSDGIIIGRSPRGYGWDCGCIFRSQASSTVELHRPRREWRGFEHPRS